MKKRNSLILLLLGLMLMGCQPLTPLEPLDTVALEERSVPDGERAEVEFVIDGDTIEVLLNGKRERVRYIGIDTPERDEPYYEEATNENRRLVDNEVVILVRDVSDRDQYGRLLRYIYLEDGLFVNAQLMADGYARRVTFPPDVAEQAYFGELQRVARENGYGLWGLSELSGSADCVCDRNAYNCSDFETQSAAQGCYQICIDAVGEDVHRLDGGGDGKVCERLP